MSNDAERARIEEMAHKWLEATNRPGEAGATGYASFFTETAVCLPPNAERIDGRPGIHEMALGFTSLDDWSMTWRVTHVDLAATGEQALVVGEFELSGKDPDGNLVSDRGKFFDGLEKQADGSWLCSVACWNTSLPAA